MINPLAAAFRRLTFSVTMVPSVVRWKRARAKAPLISAFVGVGLSYFISHVESIARDVIAVE